jgi:hypothetical protein
MGCAQSSPDESSPVERAYKYCKDTEEACSMIFVLNNDACKSIRDTWIERVIPLMNDVICADKQRYDKVCTKCTGLTAILFGLCSVVFGALFISFGFEDIENVFKYIIAALIIIVVSTLVSAMILITCCAYFYVPRKVLVTVTLWNLYINRNCPKCDTIARPSREEDNPPHEKDVDGNYIDNIHNTLALMAIGRVAVIIAKYKMTDQKINSEFLFTHPDILKEMLEVFLFMK